MPRLETGATSESYIISRGKQRKTEKNYSPRLLTVSSSTGSGLNCALHGYGIISVIWPAMVKVITPPHMHMSVETLSSAGMLASSTVAAPGVHGAVVAGMHGIGVSTPNAAAVAAATTGFAGDMHMPKGMMFSIGTMSMILAAGMLLVIIIFVGSTTSVLGAIPNEHIIIAPIDRESV